MPQVMPQALYSADAEKAVLGCMLAQPNEVIPAATASLQREDFFVPAHREIFRVLSKMFDSMQTIDVMTVHQAFVDDKIDEQIGSPGILAELLTGFATHLNVGSYIETVREKSQRRLMVEACQNIVQCVQDGSQGIEETLTYAEGQICAIARQKSRQRILTAKECVDRYRVLREAIQIGEVATRIPTGLEAIDHGNGGLPTPCYVIVAGEQGSGKSALVLAIMRNCCERGMGIGGFSLEMTTEQLIQRLAAERMRCDSRRLNGKLHPSEEADENWALDGIEKWNFHIDPTSGLKPADIRRGTRRMVDAGCSIIWLDNAQLMQGSNEDDVRHAQLTEVSRTIQDVQKEHGIIFILVAQVTRKAQQAAKGKASPLSIYDLADCAAFERDARVVIILDKLHDVENAPANATPIIINVAKYSEGATGSFEATFNKSEQRII